MYGLVLLWLDWYTRFRKYCHRRAQPEPNMASGHGSCAWNRSGTCRARPASPMAWATYATAMTRRPGENRTLFYLTPEHSLPSEHHDRHASDPAEMVCLCCAGPADCCPRALEGGHAPPRSRRRPDIPVTHATTCANNLRASSTCFGTSVRHRDAHADRSVQWIRVRIQTHQHATDHRFARRRPAAAAPPSC